MTGSEFVRQVMVLLDAPTAAALAEKMHWRRGMERTVARWLAGTSEPSFVYTIDMATKAGLLTGGEVAVADLPSAAPHLEVLLEGLAGADDEIQANQEKGLVMQQQMLAELQEIRAALGTARSDEPAAPRRSTRKR